MSHAPTQRAVVFTRKAFPALLAALQQAGYRTLGPTVRDGAIVYDEIRAVEDLPVGWTDEQDAGTYRLIRRNDAALFGYVVGPHSWKPYLFPPQTTLWSATSSSEGFEVADPSDPPPRQAFLGVRACELAAIRIQERVFAHGSTADPTFVGRRRASLIIAVQCGEAHSTCFCASVGTGPSVGSGYDLMLTELLSPERHAFLATAGTPAGEALLAKVPHRAATEDDLREAAAAVAHAAAGMGRHLETEGLKEMLQSRMEHPAWEEAAARCLGCANCTQVCPTCFCSTVQDVTDLTASRAGRRRVWDSCFSETFSYLHGGSVRRSAMARYRQCLTHKLASWIDQFGSLGCVGCGRCITWCPVGIDMTASIRALRAEPEAAGGGSTIRSGATP